MKPFLLLATRGEDSVAAEEYDAMLRFSGLAERDLRWRRLNETELGSVDLSAWSGIVLGGSPFTVSDPPASKSALQQRVEAELRDLAVRVVEADFPFLGACYGIGTLGTLCGGVVDRRYAESVTAPVISLTDAGREDPLFAVLPDRFLGFVGHKEAVSRLPDGAVLLASSPACPVQAFRLGRNVYATQFHPELDAVGACSRIEIYRHHGYFEPHAADELMGRARDAVVTEPPRILARFVELFAR